MWPAAKRARLLIPSLDDLTTVKESPGKGLGLFAARDIAKGKAIAQMREPGRMKKVEWEVYLQAHPCLPHDAAIQVERSPLVFYDQSWLGQHYNVPRWYRLNHSARPNTHMIILDRSKPAREQEVAWVTMRDIRAGEELAFEYTDVPDEWNAA